MRWREAIFLILLSALPRAVDAQFVSTPLDARSGAMGGCLLVDTDKRTVSMSYRQGFALVGMADKQLTLMWPTGKLGFAAATYMHHGTLDYHEQQASVGYALHATEWLLVGVGGTWLNMGTSDPHYTPQHWLAATAYLQASVARTQLALLAGTRPWDSMHPYRFHLQAQYSASTHLLTVVEFEFEECARLRMGMEYDYENRVLVRAGMATAPLVATFGLGFRHSMFSIDLGAEVHQTLGITPHTTLTICF